MSGPSRAESSRHSGAPRSGEPGIHKRGHGLWIPGSRLSAAPRDDRANRTNARAKSYANAVIIRAVASTFAVAVMLSAPALAASAENGRAAYIAHGCWQCHGFAGQGGIAGPELASDPI